MISTEHFVLDHEDYRFVLDEYRRGDDQMLICHLNVLARA